MSEKILSLNNITKRYGKQLALDNVNITINKGDIYGLIGRNGAGKTTIMKIATGLAQQTSGDIVLLNSKPSNSKVLERIGAVIEAPVAYKDLDAYQNMKVACELKGISDKTLIEEALTIVNLGDTGKKKFRQFSLGMKQRLGIAMALVSKPDFLILDEPINGLDPIAIVEFRGILERINKEYNTTILISSHILTELYHVSTRFGFIHNGRMIEEVEKSVLDQKFNATLILKTVNPGLAATVLMDLGITTYTVVSGNEIHIHTTLTSAELNKCFVQNDVPVDMLAVRENNLENYYTDLIKNIEEN
ncbi:ATP-binding cassette domain-containing protein [Erysipelothrix sp. HDW6C]|uniref:ABC transporter ATP-binding protein n=1 Tax=Erysipelothrix sp. HDW6C TaxID=2714930 RepID=UPI00140CB5EB|nr:ATP-binding cassette domain-containing protein [Erysipelothrix sp. HDW6C]QIK69161.1 ATP-binding cassette domain-containing protein [Erysipelothrix sp. HDW6C]